MKRGSLFIKLKISGNGAESLIKTLHARNIWLKDVIFGENYLFLTVDYKDSRKIFAICRNMCYNVKRIGIKGRLSPVYAAIKNAGFVLGAMAFAAFAFISDAFVSEISFEGDAVSYRREITAALKESGVSVGKPCFADVSVAGEKIALAVDGLSYVTIEKRGKRIIAFAKSEEVKSEPLDVKKTQIVSPVDGVVRALNCLSGTAKVSVGDAVKVGDLLISGCFTNKNGEEFTTYALGEVCLVKTVVYEYQAAEHSELYRSRAVFLAKESAEGEVESTAVESISRDGKLYYIVTMSVLVIVN